MKILFPVFLSFSSALAVSGVFKGAFHGYEDSWNTNLSVRLTEGRNLGFARLDLTWAVSPSMGNPAVKGPDDNYSSYRIADFEPRITPEDWDGDNGFSLLQNLDRLNLQFRPGNLKVTAGRQAIYWGVSKTVSPTDFIAPFPYGTIDTDYRVGVDAVRAVYPVGMLSEVESGAVFGEGLENNGFWARGRFYTLKTDLTATAALFNGTSLAGGSLNRALGGAVVWVEGAWSRHESGTSWWNMSSGAERSFLQSRLYGYTEYHFNSAGTDDPGEYLSETAGEPYRNGTVYLLGRHYAAAGVSFSASPLLSLSANTLLNMSDRSMRIDLSGDYSLSDNGSLESGFSTGTGSLEDEFGGIPLTFYCIYSLYFQ